MESTFQIYKLSCFQLYPISASDLCLHRPKLVTSLRKKNTDIRRHFFFHCLTGNWRQLTRRVYVTKCPGRSLDRLSFSLMLVLLDRNTEVSSEARALFCWVRYIFILAGRFCWKALLTEPKAVGDTSRLWGVPEMISQFEVLKRICSFLKLILVFYSLCLMPSFSSFLLGSSKIVKST